MRDNSVAATQSETVLQRTEFGGEVKNAHETTVLCPYDYLKSN